MNSLFVFILVVCCSYVLSQRICDGSKHLEWKNDPSDCNTFYLCFGTLQHKYNCEKDLVYSIEKHTCVEKGSESDTCTKSSTAASSPKESCKDAKTFFLPYEDSCAKYIDCSSVSVEECPYPLLFDEDKYRCVRPEKANCGVRTVFKDPCDYEENDCRSAMGCIPCQVRFPSCKGLPNGLNPWIGREGSPYYAVCSNERVVYHDMCDFEQKKEIFHPEKRTCEAIYK